ncbi:MAG: DUF4179 domain-containing protein [Paenibacillaceae bacterium]|nr:DUF4179 domain-containing protein [Paenibacillaceae bacterium]
MVDREENLLARYFDGVRIAEKQIGDEQLEAAIRHGLEQGRNLRGKWHLRRGLAWTAGAAGTLAMCLLLLFVWPSGSSFVGSPLSPTTASQNEVIPNYVSALMTSEMERAAEHGLYQPIRKSTEVAGTKVTVDGVLADGRTVVVFYSMVNPEDVKAVDNFYGYLIDMDGDIFINLPRQSGTSFVDSKDVKHSYFKITFDQDAPTQAGFAVDSRVTNSDPIAKIPIAWSSRPYEGMEKVVPVKQTATVNRTKIAIREVSIRPLSTIIVFEPQMRTDVHMAVNLKAKLYLGEKQESQFHYYTRSKNVIYDHKILSNNEVNLQGIEFESLYYSDWNEVTLQIDGFGTLSTKKRSFDLVIDTEKNQLHATDSTILKVNIIHDQQSTLVRIYAEKKTKVDVGLPFQIEEEFTDREGAKHRFLQVDGKPSDYMNDSTTEVITFELEPKTYTQPLTFTLTEVVDSTYKPQEFKIPLK